MSETTAHRALARFLTIAQAKLPELAFVWHTANESAGGAKTARGVPYDVLKEASMGVVPGVWDWLYIGPDVHKQYSGIAIELKSDEAYRRRACGLTAAQLVWRDHYDACGWATYVYPESDWTGAALLLVAYLGGNPDDFRFS